ncbi:MAG: M16 family metallopeptidase [Bdellovibrionales bacterium]
MKSFGIATLLFFTVSALSQTPSKLKSSGAKMLDPFSHVEHVTLSNGLQIFFAPSAHANNVDIRLEVLVGWRYEDREMWGVSHLLEHVLFRDKQLKDEMSYLQLIRESGGEANGMTLPRRTAYFGTIPYKKGPWLLQKFSKMLLEPSFTQEYVEKEKGTVELERGRPGPITQVLGFNPVDYLVPPYLKPESFWKSEFGVSLDEPYTLSQEQLATQRITLAHVEKHYKDYYYPSNMRLFVAGRFSRDEMMKLIQSKWGRLPAREGKKISAYPRPRPKQSPFKRIVHTDSAPVVEVGTKIWDSNIKESMIVYSYLDYLSHRLMKEIRNVKGQTYSANPHYDIEHGYGYASVQFQTPEENLDENLQIVRNYIRDEAEQGNINPQQVQEAVELYLAAYYRMGQEAYERMWLATEYEKILDQHGKFTSPFLAMRNVTPQEFAETLKKHFTPQRRYEYVQAPSVFFTYDIYLFLFLTALTVHHLCKRFLTKPFLHNEVRWVRKVRLPPFRILEGLALVLAWLVFSHVNFGLDLIFKNTIFQSHLLLSHYLPSLIWVVLLLMTVHLVLAAIPHKLMVMKNHLVLKSVTYGSRHMPLSKIARVSHVSLFSRAVFQALFRYRTRFYLYLTDPFFRKGLLIETLDGQAYYLSVRYAEDVKAELEGFLGHQESLVKAS